MVIRAFSCGRWRVIWQSELQGKWQWPTFSALALLNMCALIHVCALAVFARQNVSFVFVVAGCVRVSQRVCKSPCANVHVEHLTCRTASDLIPQICDPTTAADGS